MEPIKESSAANSLYIRTSENDEPELVEQIYVFINYILIVCTFPLSLLVCMHTAKEYERAVIFRLGRLKKGGLKGPGIFFTLCCAEESQLTDLRTQSFDVPPQEILSKDSVTLTVDAVVYFRISDPLKCVIQVNDASGATQLLAQTTLRNVAGKMMLMDLLTAKHALSHAIEIILDEATDAWGIKVERVEIKDVQLPQSLQRAMAAEAEAVREAKAKVVAAEGELNASRSLKEASDVMAQNPLALQLRYLQTLSSISAERNSTIIFPFPVELVKTIVGGR